MLCILMVVVISIPSSAISAKTTNKKLLKNTITYCDKMDKSDYTSKTWKTFQKELKDAKTVYNKKKSNDKAFVKEKENLEKAKANLMFVTSKDKGNPLLFRQLTTKQIVSEMGAGWNLGNTMDGHDSSWNPSETAWQSDVTTKALIKSVHDLGFNTIRIPVTWGTMINDKKDYAIDDTWISRVQDIVDYAISQDMYVIINIHHDGVGQEGGWLNSGAENIDSVYEKFEHTWRNIANRFKDYDEHLIFEDMNEVGYSDYFSDTAKVVNFNQIFVNVVRSTGSNNSQRWLSVPPRQTNIELASNSFYGFTMPKDTVKNRIFVSVHYYDNGLSFPENKTTTEYYAQSIPILAEDFKNMADTFTSKGIPVILGEYGAVNKNNSIDRALYYEGITKICQNYGIVACAWDSNGYDPTQSPDYAFGIIDRKNNKSIYPEVMSGIMRGTYLKSTSKKFADVVKNPVITKISGVTFSDTALSMTIGDSKIITTKLQPTKTNDILLWKTADPTVVTVSNGHVLARGIGTTTLTAFSQSGSFTENITVTVKAKSSSKPCTAIVADKDSYEVATGKYLYLNASCSPSDSDDYLTYKSSNESVATVSTIGKIVGISEGTADIIVVASNGITKTIKVTVTASTDPVVVDNNNLKLALNVYYNDSTHAYFKNENGKPVEITGNGQYTVTFNCDDDLTRSAVDVGVKSLSNIGAIYIKDYRVTESKLTQSGLASCDIMYNKITVDGVDLTITQTAPKSGIKNTGVFDTNDPINAYDGSCVKEVTTKSNVINFSGIKNPKKITITFTISNLVYKK